jgi:exodeoxyribonuclease VII large subunit
MQHTLNLFQSTEYSVSGISNEIKHIIEANLGYVRVRGEISGLKVASSGHGYFNLKDQSAILACTCWKSSMSRVPVKLEDGIEVIAIGRISTYAGQSKYQLSVEQIELSGTGNLMQILQLRKEQLMKEGLFASEHKKPLPFLPKTIGVITSITGSVIKDIIHRIEDRFPSRVLIWPTMVQGETAAGEVANAIDGFNKLEGEMRPDVIIVARGGGSIEDLWAFNEEIVVRAVFNSQIPIISAIGHETDFTLIDLASDIRAPTPTAAAEFAVPVLNDFRSSLDNYIIILSKRLASYINYREHLLTVYSGNLNLQKFVLQKEQKFDDICFKFFDAPSKYFRIKDLGLIKYNVLNLKPSQLISNLMLKLNSANQNLKYIVTRLYENKLNQVNLYNSLLQTLDVSNVLKRGFALVKQDGKVVSYKEKIALDKPIDIHLQDGSITAKTTG